MTRTPMQPPIKITSADVESWSTGDADILATELFSAIYAAKEAVDDAPEDLKPVTVVLTVEVAS